MTRRACAHQGCLALVERGSRCEEHELPKKPRGVAAERRRNAKRQARSTGAARRLRETLRQVEWYQCAACLCRHHWSELEVDHVVPLMRGGTDQPGNLQVLCRMCHRVKTSEENSR